MADTKISDLTAATSVADADLIPIVQSGTNKQATRELVRGYKVYTALLTQTSTNAPVATVLENTLGGTVVWGYTGAGNYTATLASAFTANKTWVVTGASFFDAVSTAEIVLTSTNVITLVIAPGDDFLVSFPIEIRVYP